MLTFATFCSGIGAPEQAWTSLGWQPLWTSEIEPFPSSVLAEKHPEAVNLGNMEEIDPHEAIKTHGRPDVVCAGTPCQSFSVAGLRGGMDDPRGNLALVYLKLVDAMRPTWVVWENVPGVLSSGQGRDFGSFVGALGQLGYGWAYRVLDAQYFGVPQRRRRVFVVGYLGDWRRAAAVLFERTSMCGNTPPSRAEGKGSSHEVAPCIGASGRGFERTGETIGQDPVVACPLTSNQYGDHESRESLLVPCAYGGGNQAGELDVSTTLSSHGGTHGRLDFESETFVAGSATSQDAENGMLVAFGWQNSASQGDDVHEGTSPTLDKSKTPAVNHDGVRRLTPTECERLQGFPDGYTLVNYRGKPASDGPRYKALGNSMAVPVLRWIGERIQAVDELQPGDLK